VASTAATIDHLQFRERLINELWEHAKLQAPQPGAGQAGCHWPTQHPSGNNGHCQYTWEGRTCGRNCTHWCQACSKRGCMVCLERAHVVAHDFDAS
jgi:hypothetical protein